MIRQELQGPADRVTGIAGSLYRQRRCFFIVEADVQVQPVRPFRVGLAMKVAW